MSICDINLLSSFFQIGGKYRTSDGKILTLTHFCLEEPSPATDRTSPINLAGIKPGQQVRTGDGKLLTFESADGLGRWPYAFKDSDGGLFRFTPDGIYSATLQPSASDIIQILPVPVPQRTGISLAGLKPGQKVLTKGGEMLTFQQVVDESPWPYVFLRESGSTYSYTVDGSYWGGDRRPNDKDIIKILPVPILRLDDVPIGSTFRTRSGAILKLELNFSSEHSFYGKPLSGADSYRYQLDGTSKLGDGYDVVEIISRPAEPRVAIDGALTGDKFRLRGGKVYTHNGVRYVDKLQAKVPGDSLYFQLNGVCPNRDSDYEVVELISTAKASIDGAVKGDILVLRNGKRFVCTGETNPETGNKLAVRGDQSFFFRLDGVCPRMGSDYDVVELVLAPKVSIEGAKVGDTFRLRGGQEFECIGLNTISGYHLAKAKRQGESLALNFAIDGHCPVWGQGHDVVEVIPAPEPSLADKVFDQVSKVEASSVDVVVISSKDFMLHFTKVQARLRDLKIFTLCHSAKVEKGCFEIRFK